MNNQPFASSRAQTAEYDEGLRSYMLGVYNYMTAALALTGIVAYLVANTELINLFYAMSPEGYVKPTILAYAAMFAPLIMVFYLGAKVMNMSMQKAQTCFWVFAGLMGLSLTHIFLTFTGESIVKVLFVTSGAFAGLSLYGYSTKKDLSGMGTFLIMGVVGLLITMVVNMFLQSPAVHFAMSAIGVLIFAGLTAYDTQAIRRSYYEVGANQEVAAKMSIMGALRLYLDFINLFVFLLQFLGNRE